MDNVIVINETYHLKRYTDYWELHTYEEGLDKAGNVKIRKRICWPGSLANCCYRIIDTEVGKCRKLDDVLETIKCTHAELKEFFKSCKYFEVLGDGEKTNSVEEVEDIAPKRRRRKAS